ncbi:MAG: V-type ATP synthase subunit E [Desulfurococcales archaeon]|nr:V-type ATP synthase subunit E [Desulfurococcales archaeon]
MGLESLRDAVLAKAEEKAKRVLEEAEEKAKSILEEAQKEYERRLQAAKENTLRELEEEEFRKYTAKLKELNEEILKVKREILNDLLNTAKEKIASLSAEERKNSLKNLLEEALHQGVVKGDFIIYVVNKDVELVKDVARELGVDGRLKEVKTLSDSYVGGLIVESAEGDAAVDSTYYTRLDRALRALYDKLNKELFKG